MKTKILFIFCLLLNICSINAQDNYMSIQAQCGAIFYNSTNDNAISSSHSTISPKINAKILFNASKISVGLFADYLCLSRHFTHEAVGSTGNTIKSNPKISIASPAFTVGATFNYNVWRGLFLFMDIGYMQAQGDGKIKTVIENGEEKPSLYSYPKSSGISGILGVGYVRHLSRHIDLVADIAISHSWLKFKDNSSWLKGSFEINYIPVTIGIKYKF